MSIEDVAAGDLSVEAPLIEHSALALRRIFESEEVGFFHATLAERQRVAVGHDELVILVLCATGEIVLTEGARELILVPGSYAVVPEGQTGEIAARDGGAEAVLFFGFEQLPGAFFNSYGSAHV